MKVYKLKIESERESLVERRGPIKSKQDGAAAVGDKGKLAMP